MLSTVYFLKVSRTIGGDGIWFNDNMNGITGLNPITQINLWIENIACKCISG